MQHVNIYALKKDRKKILELIQRRGYIEVQNPLSDDDVFLKEDVSMNKANLEKNVVLIKDTIIILEKYQNNKNSILSALNGRKEITTKAYDDFCKRYDNVLLEANHIHNISKKIPEKQTEIVKLQVQKELLLNFSSLDIPVNFDGTKNTSAFIGTLPNTWTEDMIYEKLVNITPIHVEVIGSSKEITGIFVISLKENEDHLFETIRSMGFCYPDSSFTKVPSEKLLEIEKTIEELKDEINKIEKELETSVDKIEDFKFLQDYDTIRAEKYEAIGQLLQSNSVFVFSGYIPEDKVQILQKDINDKFEAYIEIEEPSEDDDVPTLLKNNGFSSPLQTTVESFGPPDKKEIDPTMVMSLFYYMLFGLMLSDAAYGAIITIACAIGLIKYKATLEESLKKTLRMYLFCGISTVFWGVMFGSYFGDLVDVVSKNFFGKQITIPPLWFFPVNEPMRMLVFCMLIGVIHLLTGLSMKLINNIRAKDYKSIVYDVFFWYVLLISSILYLLSMELFVNTLGLSFTLPQSVGEVSGVLFILSAVGILATNGRESRNPFKRFLKGLYALYGITGYLSDVLSYSRLLALGLATGVICTVINKMASMTIGIPFAGPVIFVIIIILGHTLNIGINALGAYVHTNRLQYVEFFGKFYGGNGRKFQPLSIKTKYFKFKEEKQNE